MAWCDLISVYTQGYPEGMAWCDLISVYTQGYPEGMAWCDLISGVGIGNLFGGGGGGGGGGVGGQEQIRGRSSNAAQKTIIPNFRTFFF